MSLVLYSAWYGEAEPLNAQVFGPFDSCRRVLFTDRQDLSLPGVEVIHEPAMGLDPARASRRAKLMPHRYFPDAEWSIWIDNKSILRRDPRDLLARLQSATDAGFLAFPHFRRDCVYQELRTAWELGLDDPRILHERARTYRQEGMPERFGLIEGHFLIRRHNTPDIARFGERWFEHVLRFSRRDQVSFPYLAWRTGLRYEPITMLDWRDTVTFTVFDRKARKPEFRRHDMARQIARRIWRGIRLGGGT